MKVGESRTDEIIWRAWKAGPPDIKKKYTGTGREGLQTEMQSLAKEGEMCDMCGGEM